MFCTTLMRRPGADLDAKMVKLGLQEELLQLLQEPEQCANFGTLVELQGSNEIQTSFKRTLKDLITIFIMITLSNKVVLMVTISQKLAVVPKTSIECFAYNFLISSPIKIDGESE